MLPVFVECRGTDGVQLASGECRLEQIARGDGAFTRAPAPTMVCSSSMNRMIRAFAGDDFAKDGFESILEFASELRAGQKLTDIERDDSR